MYLLCNFLYIQTLFTTLLCEKFRTIFDLTVIKKFILVNQFTLGTLYNCLLLVTFYYLKKIVTKDLQFTH